MTEHVNVASRPSDTVTFCSCPMNVGIPPNASTGKINLVFVFSEKILHKVKKILKGSQDSIPSPSEEIQIMGGKVCLRCKGKALLGVVNKLLKKKFVDIAQQWFALLLTSSKGSCQ